MSVLSRPQALPTHSQLTALLDGTEDALLLFDNRRRVSFCNRAAMRTWGCEPGQDAEPALARLAEPAHSELIAALGAVSGEGHWHAQLVDGRRLHLALTMAPGGGRCLRALPETEQAAAPRADPAATSELVRLLWDAPQPLTVQDTQFRVVAANRAYCEAVGHSPQQLLGHDPMEFAPETDRAMMRESREVLLAALHEGRQPDLRVERRFIDAHGRERWFRFAPRWVSADNGAPLMLAILHDVTLEHVARAQVDRSVHELEHWFDLSPIGMLVYDPAGLIVRSNAAFEALIGSVPLVLRDAPAELAQLLAWEDDRPNPALRPDQPALEVRGGLALPDGRRLRLRSRLRAYRTDSGQVRVMAVIEDRTLEDERDLAQLEIGALMDTAGIGVATYEASQGWLKPRGQGRGGSSGDGGGAAAGSMQTGLQSIGRDQVEPGSREEFERLQRALREGRRAQVRYAVKLPELGLRWLLTRVEPGELAGGRTALSVVTLDITDQEESHRRNEQLLRELSTILDGTSAGIAYVRAGTLVRCNRRFEAMMGLSEGHAGAAISAVFGAQPAVLALVQRALDEDGRFETEFAHLGEWFAISVSRTLAEAEPEAVAVLTDVTRLKAQQAELEALARERELMFTLTDVGIAYLRDGRIERANEAMARLTGYTTEALAQLPLVRLFESEAAYDSFAAEQRSALQAQGWWRGERRLRRRDGRLAWVQVSKRCVAGNDPAAGLICSYVDIDERRRAREVVQLQAERTRAILDSVLVGIVTVGDGGIEWMNRSARRMFGGELADFVGEPIAIVATAEAEHPLRATHYLKSLDEGQAETFECRLRGRDGREFWVVGNAVVTGREQTGAQITFALLDIERRRQAEISIAQAQASLQRIIETAPLAIALFDGSSGRVLRLNHMAAMFFGQPVEAVLGRMPQEWLGADEAGALQSDLQQALAQSEGLRREQPRSLAGEGGAPGERRIWDTRIVSLESAGEPQLLLVASDVTEQRAAEQARYEAAVAQREMLVKEVHHRIKNNLQGVAGLLQQTAVRRPEVAALISEAVGQVQAIAQVHGLQVGVSGPLRIKPLLEAITASVQRTFGRPIRVEIEGEAAHRFALPEAESIPIALTVNELLTNAIKHSTPGDVRCVLRCEEGRVAITIANPGQLRSGFSLAQVAPGVSGLGLVRALLPRRTATLSLLQVGAEVQACVVLVPPSVKLLEPL
ncbi:PAS domain S-box protein [Aquincola sp. S2]|uniref:PAS domain S-box protein n=1 Tax=Pseudaquabacterium terrae TaxID=2732868 RepID=A0ABX2ENW9_9BURK|nr:PAS domain S-box protein [Aquabacterium terrae]NRF70341.1 PAS domain S-box protein [Aquabacterium terrae]